MPKVLVVDDNADNRELIATVLRHHGHTVLQAVDGIDGLTLAHAERPDLIISDILMPSMDGYEFVRQLRASPLVAQTRVIFYTAYYHEREARHLATACGVSRVLVKPCEPREILRVVDDVLVGRPQDTAPTVTPDFDREHLRLVTDKLSVQAEALRLANASLAALIDLNLQLASEREPQVLLEKVCRGARALIGAKYGFLTVRDKNSQEALLCATSGIDVTNQDLSKPLRIDTGPLARTLANRLPCRFTNPIGDPAAMGLPANFPPAHALVAAPVVSLTADYGWLCLADKLGADGFSAEDQRLLSILAAQVGRIYENGSLYQQVQRHTESLLLEMAERERATVELRQSEERTRSIVESALDAVVVMDATGHIIDWNKQAEKTFGWSREEAMGAVLADTIIPTRYREAHTRGVRAFLETAVGPILNSRLELTATHRDGQEFPVELTVSAIRNGSGWIFSSFIRDLTEAKRAEQALEQLRHHSELILESIGEGIHGIDIEGRIIFENPAAAKLLGYTAEELVGRPAHATMHHSKKDGTPVPVEECPIYATMRDGVTRRVENEVFWRRDGSSFPVEYTTAPIRGTGNKINGAVVAFRDITERRESLESISRLNRLYSVLSSINTLIVRVRDRDELFRSACRIAVEAGAFRMAFVGVIDPETRDGTVVAWHGGDEGCGDWVRITARDGTPYSDRPACRAVRLSQPVIINDLAADPSMAELRDELARRGHKAVGCFPLTVAGQATAVIALFAAESNAFDEEETRLLLELAGDLSFALDHLEKSERLNYLAYYDALTGLANRTFFHERLSQYASEGNRSERRFALVIADLERLDAVNDSLGHHAGDRILRQVAERLVRCVGQADEVARIGPGRFATVMHDLKTEEEVARTLEEWRRQRLDEPFEVDGNELRIFAKAGIALFPGDGRDADSLLKNAEAALNKAKTTGDRQLFYAPHLSEKVAERLALENRLRRALDNEEFVLHYQPKVDLETRELHGVEALIRWRSPELGLVPPASFIPVMEETGLIADVGLWVVRQACVDRSLWRAKGLRAPRVAVNVSTVQLRRNDFVRSFTDALEHAGAHAGIDIEVTESLIMEDVEANIRKLVAIRELGVGIAIDDFGTGYSSLAYLAKLPVKTLKIDRSFTAAMLDDPSIMTLVSTTITLAHSMRLTVVAEGVESEEQAKILRLLRCDQMQGYLISKPLSLDDMGTYLERQDLTAGAQEELLVHGSAQF